MTDTEKSCDVAMRERLGRWVYEAAQHLAPTAESWSDLLEEDREYYRTSGEIVWAEAQRIAARSAAEQERERKA